MAKPKVVLTRRWPKACEDRASELFDAKINRDDKPMSAAELQDALRSIDALFPTVTDKITAEVLGVSPRQAKLIGNFGVGFNNIDVEAAKKHGLVVTNTPDVLTDCTADIAMTLLLMAARRAGEGERHVRNKQWTGWRPTHMLGHKVTGKTLGVLGFGRIGRAVAHRAHHGFGMKIIFNDPFPPSDADIKAVAKDSGIAGGLPDKIEAARLEKCQVVVVQRPDQESSGTFGNFADLLDAVRAKVPVKNRLTL